ncbi:metal-dependent transcriptional regulator [Actinoplanes sp. NPDC051851]|uniref:metal-dependent transcriptional regulator n=1 Tax=Actinoplanes sp. NPDC051851 TaxID=3154753 RepID=UPI003430119A
MTAGHVAETYLRVILELEEDRIPPLRARLAERTANSLPLVCQNITRLERRGLVRLAPDRRLILTRPGRRLAVAALRKHRLAELLLVEIIGLPPDQATREAPRWVHVLTDRAERHIHTLLGHPSHSTTGRPIPGLTHLDPR